MVKSKDMEAPVKELSITKEKIQERLDQLLKEQEQARSTLLAYEGAIQDCRYWFKEFGE